MERTCHVCSTSDMLNHSHTLEDKVNFGTAVSLNECHGFLKSLALPPAVGLHYSWMGFSSIENGLEFHEDQ
ncbi:hypothetical protein P7K49_020134 [Saguinus oedipus]|uniref:Uncharacterized protein n=1 Tax=Saguinus oedipus TaxID=9490 RepID=A0ABQ9UZE4_SAGOE|nr:hypothetical protein P7K49_020134 [Saguinus oedipus]